VEEIISTNATPHPDEAVYKPKSPPARQGHGGDIYPGSTE